MSAKFTPGPWRVEEGTGLVWGACNPDDSTSNGMGVPVAEAKPNGQARWHDRHPIDWDEAIANAHLIAAAPDGYTVGEKALQWMLRHAADPEAAEIIDELSAFLAKARGEK